MRGTPSNDHPLPLTSHPTLLQIKNWHDFCIRGNSKEISSGTWCNKNVMHHKSCIVYFAVWKHNLLDNLTNFMDWWVSLLRNEHRTTATTLSLPLAILHDTAQANQQTPFVHSSNNPLLFSCLLYEMQFPSDLLISCRDLWILNYIIYNIVFTRSNFSDYNHQRRRRVKVAGWLVAWKIPKYGCLCLGTCP